MAGRGGSTAFDGRHRWVCSKVRPQQRPAGSGGAFSEGLARQVAEAFGLKDGLVENIVRRALEKLRRRR